MKTSTTETIRIEKFLAGELAPDERLVFEAEMIISPGLRANTFSQRLVYRLVTLYHRRQVKREIQALSDRLLSDPKTKDLWDPVLKQFKS